MDPYYSDDWLTVYAGDNRVVLATLPEQSVHCVVTSPPYWSLRDYGNTGQLGLEPTPEAYVANMVDVFRAVRRVLRDDGTVWLNLGDTYAAGGQTGRRDGGRPEKGRGWAEYDIQRTDVERQHGVKPKDLVGIPWRVAFALQADGWYLRSDIVWSKPNPMPESVTDRPTKSHEYLFLLSKSPRYYFDADAVREAAIHAGQTVTLGPKSLSKGQATGMGRAASGNGKADSVVVAPGRNLRSVWTIATQPYPGAHFATFPEALVEPCVKAGTSERGVCPECGAPWERAVEREGPSSREWQAIRGPGTKGADERMGRQGKSIAGGRPPDPARSTTGWAPSCEHHDSKCEADPIGGHHWIDHATVLDPFAGSGTTGRVAQRLGRRAVLIDLNPDYLAQALRRIGEGRGSGQGPALDIAVPFAADGLWGEDVA